MDEIMTGPEMDPIWTQSPAQVELIIAMQRLNEQLENFERADREAAEERLLRMARVYGHLQIANGVGVGDEAGDGDPGVGGE